MDNKQNFPDPRGSEWRRWDLQIHTPGTKLSNQYKVDDPEKDVWDEFIGYIKKSDVDVFGITDYFSIDRYIHFIEKIKSDTDIKRKVFFPNIEFRLDVSLNEATEQLQCHLIFDNQLATSKIKLFLSRLSLTNKKPDGSPYYCTDEDIIACGGYDSISISKDDLDKALQNNFGKSRPYFIVGVASGMGSLRAANTKIKKRLADEFDKFCDIFFGNRLNRDFYLRRDRYEDKNIEAIPKPVITCSDSHSFQDLNNYLKKQYQGENGEITKDITWIKSDKSFDGLMQIKYEPDERVKIGYDQPDQKKSYYVIDKIGFLDNTGQKNFTSDPIEINQNLTTIIGGKSTGKSLLLHYLAKTIDCNEVEERLLECDSESIYNFDDDTDFNFEVIWADGQKMLLTDERDNEAERKILYIPQNYLDKLTKKNVKSRETINNFIKNVLLQDESLRKKHDSFSSQIKTLCKSIQLGITNLYQIRQELIEIHNTIKELGNENGIEKYINYLKKAADEIKNKSGLSLEEKTKYEKLLELEQSSLNTISKLSEDKKYIKEFKSFLDCQFSAIIETKDEYVKYISTDEVKKAFLDKFSELQLIKKKNQSSIDEILTLIERKEKDDKSSLKESGEELGPIMTKIKLQEELKRKIDAIKEEQAKLNKIFFARKIFASKKELFNSEKENLINAYKEIFDSYDSLRNEFKKFENNFDDISLSISIGFKEKEFNEEVINRCLNKPDIKRIISGFEWKEEFEYKFNPIKHNKFISQLFFNVLNNKIKTIKNISAKDALLKILEDYFELEFNISFKNDSLDKMSPGKKGLVLLRLLIDLSNEEWPILLDQPDDDLDNRSIYIDLVTFLKKKKKHRQMIMITHNPNLVVGADAEEVIVANQDGQEVGRENKKFRFEYVSCALENSFQKTKREESAILFRKGIRQHVCEILEGGKEAFQKREKKYCFEP